MRFQHIVTATAAVVGLAAGFAAVAQSNEPAGAAAVPVERIYVQPVHAPYGPYHGGYVTDSDAQLLSDAVWALESDRRMDGSILTMVANQGELVVNGTTTSVVQALQVEDKLKHLNGSTRVTAWFDSPGA